MSLLAMLFLGFCALIVVMQLIPAILMFCGMVRGLTSIKTIKGEIK